MAISVVPGSASITINNRPAVHAPLVEAANVRFTAEAIQATGSVTLDGLPTDPREGWFAGWIQAQWIETNWGYFRGRSNNHGSVFYQRARPPARVARNCRDTLGPVDDIFYGTRGAMRPRIPSTGEFPRTLSALISDRPADLYPITVINSLTGERNFLREVQLEFHFASVFVVRDPDANVQQLLHFYWNLRWQYRFTPTAFPPGVGTLNPVAISAGVGANVSPIFQGAATDRRFADVLTAPQTENCNDVAQGAFRHPNVKESRVWDNFDVRH
jgi:hypothetical protein